MRRPVLIIPAVALALTVLAAPLRAQEADHENESGSGLMERGLQLFIEGLSDEMAPALDALSEMLDTAGPQFMAFLSQMGPALSELMQDVEDWAAYHPPEILPNGDIIMRKKTPAERAQPDITPRPENGQIDL